MGTDHRLAPRPNLTPAAAGEATEFFPQNGQFPDPLIHLLNLSLKQGLEMDAQVALRGQRLAVGEDRG